jgi:hypothetical protein
LKHHRRGKAAAGLAVVLISTWGAVQADYPIAGLTPYERPHDAPAIKQVLKDDAWYQKALTGISKPYPNSLGFLEDQGNWYTPFIHPGMTGRYDIRSWHTGD